MIVFDASAALEVALRTELGERIAPRVLGPSEHLHAPHVIDLEVVQVLRRLTFAKEIHRDRADLALEDFNGLAIQRYAHNHLVQRIWELKSALSAYDAAYVALAESLSAPLVTCDEKLSRSHGHSAKIEFVGLVRRGFHET